MQSICLEVPHYRRLGKPDIRGPTKKLTRQNRARYPLGGKNWHIAVSNLGTSAVGEGGGPTIIVAGATILRGDVARVLGAGWSLPGPRRRLTRGEQPGPGTWRPAAQGPTRDALLPGRAARETDRDPGEGPLTVPPPNGSRPMESAPIYLRQQGSGLQGATVASCTATVGVRSAWAPGGAPAANGGPTGPGPAPAPESAAPHGRGILSGKPGPGSCCG
jgi:hypothetical protein